MRIIKIYTKAIHKDGIFIEADDKKKYLLSRSLLAELRVKLMDVNSAKIDRDENPLVLSKPEIDKAEIINTYNYNNYELADEELKAVLDLADRE